MRAHPSAQALALFASSDLPWTTKVKVGHHVWHCAHCEDQVAAFRAARMQLQHDAGTSMLTGFEAVVDWARFEREMLGNIAVGVAAARCIDNAGQRRFVWRGVLLSAGLAAVFVAGWFTHIPSEQNARLMSSLRRVFGLSDSQAASSIVQATPDGIAVRTHGATLTLRHPTYAVNSMSGASSITSRYVDEDTGQVTITKVYAQ
ncbi:MAG: anti-ECFsigma factor, ChrR [Bryobacterales bacterium]|nr:anti-ECFsigma factor, ChrR [Bryobacterales bacterium]